MQTSDKKHRMIGSMAGLILGVLGVLGAVGRLGEGEDPGGTLVAGPFMILGAVAYRSRKRRLLGLRPDTKGRVVFEIACLTLLTLAWLGLRDLVLHIVEDPVPHLVIPVWALAAYPCAGLRIRR